MNDRWRGALAILILIMLYVLLGNARSIEENPFIPGANLAVNMIVPVLAGILFGPKAGAIVGFLGTAANTLTPAGSVFELAAILPHTLMGSSAGLLRNKLASPFVALTLLVGHILNIVSFVFFRLIQPELLRQLTFWIGILYETFYGVIAIVIITMLYRLGIENRWR